MLIVESTLFAEIAKWVVMGLFVIMILCVILYAPLGVYFSRKKAGLNKKKNDK